MGDSQLLEQIQSAVQMTEDGSPQQSQQLLTEAIAADLGRIGLKYHESIVDDAGNRIGERFEFGGADNHYGILVLKKSNPPKLIWKTLEMVRPQVFFYSER